MCSKSTSTDVYTWALVALERTMCSAVRRRMFENGTSSSPRAASGTISGPPAGDTIAGGGAAGGGAAGASIGGGSAATGGAGDGLTGTGATGTGATGTGATGTG